MRSHKPARPVSGPFYAIVALPGAMGLFPRTSGYAAAAGPSPVPSVREMSVGTKRPRNVRFSFVLF